MVNVCYNYFGGVKKNYKNVIIDIKGGFINGRVLGQKL
jgi:hypothetical protein